MASYDVFLATSARPTQQADHQHNIPVNFLKLKIATLANQCKRLRLELAGADSVRLRSEHALMVAAKEREEQMFKALRLNVEEVGPATHCSPRHPTHSEPSFLNSNAIL